MLRSLFGGFNDLTRGKRIVFLAINKTGSSSLWTWMDEHRVPYLMNRYREDEARKLRIIAEVKRKGIPCFTVVRNPWSRAVSSWKWNMQEKGLAPCSFEEFLRMPLAGHDRAAALPHAAAVAARGRRERRRGLPRARRPARKHRERPVTGSPARWVCRSGDALPHLKKSSSDDYRQHYTPATRALVAEIFRRDFELFGYPLDET